MDVLKNRVIEKVSTKLPELSANDIDDLVSRAEEYFTSKTKRREVPEKAFWLWVDLSLAIHKGSLSEGEAVVSSIKRGDTTISYEASSKIGISYFDDQIKKFMVVVSR